MDPSPSSWWPFAAPSEPSRTAARVAAALAAPLDAVVPAPFGVRAEHGWVWCYHGAVRGNGVGVADVLDQVLEPEDGAAEAEEWPFADRVCSVAWYVMSGVQDCIAETTTEPWPRLLRGGMANPGTRVEEGWLHWWYGPDHGAETDAVLVLPPLALTPLQDPGGGAAGAAA